MRKQVVRALLLLCISTGALAQPRSARPEVRYSSTCISMDDGLTNPFVNTILKDRRGGMWVGTMNGMDFFSFAGHVRYPLDGESVSSIAEGADGTIWASTIKGTYVFDRTKNAFAQIADGVRGYCSRVGDEIWVYDGYVLNRFPSGKTDNPTLVVFPGNISVHTVEPLSDGTVLLGTDDGGIWRFDTETQHLGRFSDGMGSTLMSIIPSGDSFFVGYYGDGVHRFSRDGHYLGKLKNLSSEYVFDMTCYDGSIWIATDGGGVNLLDPQTMKVTQMMHVPGDPSSFPSNAVTVVYDDEDGEMWIGTTRYGMFNLRKQYIHTYSDAVLNSTMGLSERSVYGLYRDEDGMFWIGTDGNGINSYDPSTGQFRHYPATFGDYLPCVTGFKGDDLLAVIYTKGFTLFNKKTGTYRPVRLNGIPDRFDDWRMGLPVACRLRDDAIMILCKGNTYIYDPVSEKSHLLLLDDGSPSPGMKFGWHSDELVMTYRYDKVYVNTFDDFVLHDLGVALGHGDIVSVSYDKRSSRIWIACSDGLCFCNYDADKRSCGAIKEVASLPFERITTLTVDEDGMVWIAAGNGLFLYDVRRDVFCSYGPFDGYTRNAILNGWHENVEDGIFYWAGSSGLVSIDTELANISRKKELPRMILNEITTDRKRFHFDDGPRSSVHIPWNSRNLTLDYSVLGISFHENARFRFVVSGVDESVVILPSSTLKLTSLAPGTYTVSAVCLPSDEVAESEPAVVRIVIDQVWYRTLIFMVFMIVLLTGLSSVLIYMAVRRNMRRNGLVESAISQKDRALMERLDNYVRENMSEEITANTLTVALGISRSALYDKVKMITGYSLNDYIKRMRIEEAIRLLKETEMNINEISYSIGFAYPRHFSSVFKELTGCSPTQYRKDLKHQ